MVNQQKTDQIFSHCPSLSGDVSPRHIDNARPEASTVPVVKAFITSALVVWKREYEYCATRLLKYLGERALVLSRNRGGGKSRESVNWDSRALGLVKHQR